MSERQLLCACLRSACVVAHVVTGTSGEVMVSCCLSSASFQNFNNFSTRVFLTTLGESHRSSHPKQPCRSSLSSQNYLLSASTALQTPQLLNHQQLVVQILNLRVALPVFFEADWARILQSKTCDMKMKGERLKKKSRWPLMVSGFTQRTS